MQNIGVKGGLMAFTAIILLILLHFTGTAELSIYALDEAKNATAAIEMWQSGSWIVPTFNGEWRFDKPPLHYYFFMFSYWLFGISEFSARFFPAIAGILTVGIIGIFCTRHLGIKTALLVLFVFLASFHWQVQFHMAVPDPFLILFYTSAMLCLYEFLNTQKPIWLNVAGTFLGLAVLSKGPVALVLAGLSFLIFLLSTCTFSKNNLTAILKPLPILLFFCIVLPWFVLVGVETQGEWLKGFFVKHHLQRYTSSLEGHGGPFWLPIVYVWVGLLAFFPFLRYSVKANYPHSPKIVDFLWSCALVPVIFFMFSGTKLPNYTVPAYPFFALLIGTGMHKAIKLEKYGLMSWNMVFMFVILSVLPFAINGFLRQNPDLEQIKYVSNYFFLTLIPAFLAIWCLYRRKAMPHFFFTALAFAALSWILFKIALPQIDKFNPVRQTDIDLLKNSNIYYFGIFNPAYSFYLQKPILDISRHLEQKSEISGYLITRESQLENFNELGIPYFILLKQQDLFENPTTVILELNPSPVD